MAEEWGLVGGAVPDHRLRPGPALGDEGGDRIAQDRFAPLAAAGLTTTIFFYVAINLMMVMGLAPVVGMPLPLFSYRRLGDDDGDDLPRPADGDRAAAADRRSRLASEAASRAVAAPWRHATGRAARR